MDKTIKKITAREILDSRGNPTLEVEIFAGEASGKFSVPAGSSKGKHEAFEKRDGDINHFQGLGVGCAIDDIHKIINKRLFGLDVTNQEEIDKILLELDGTG